MELKAAVYDAPYRNPPVCTKQPGFVLRASRTVKYRITLDCSEDIDALFKMTPYYYKTSRADQEKAAKLTQLDTRLEFFIAEYGKAENADA